MSHTPIGGGRPLRNVLHRGAIEHVPSAIVLEVQYHGHDALARVRLANDGARTLVARVPGELDLSPDDTVWIEVKGAGRVWLSGGSPTG